MNNLNTTHSCATSSSIHRLLIIDPQNDFCDIPDAALPVQGASADLHRIASLVQQAAPLWDQIVVTLDSHPLIAIERTTFWHTAQGQSVAPFTLIRSEDIVRGTYVPADARLHDYALRYTQALEASGKYVLCVWPVHCVMGTWGQNIYPPLSQMLNQWQVQQGKNMQLIFKGMHPLTEQYSAVRAEVPFDMQMLHPSTDSYIDRSTDTNQALLQMLFDREAQDTRTVHIYCCGQALSHCVKSTVTDLMARAPSYVQFTILSDASSNVSGFEDQGDAFLSHAAAQGARIQTCAQTLMTMQ